MIKKELLDILVCPLGKQPLRDEGEGAPILKGVVAPFRLRQASGGPGSGSLARGPGSTPPPAWPPSPNSFQGNA